MADIHITNIAELLSFANGEDGYGTSSEYLNVYLDNDLDFALDEQGAYANTNFEGCKGIFYVNFYGQNHTIANISYSGTDIWGFFQGVTSSSVTFCFRIYDLFLKDLNITTTNYVGAFIGALSMGRMYQNIEQIIQNCKATGTISTTEIAGGLVGLHNTSHALTIRNSAFTGNITGGSEASGLIGSHRRTNNDNNGSCNIYTSGVRANISSNGRACGLVGSNTTGGYAWGGTIQKCYFIGNFNGNNSSIYGITYSTEQRSFQENYAVIKKANTTVIMDNAANIYDNDVVSDAEITITGGTPETTEHLKDASYMRDTYNWSA